MLGPLLCASQSDTYRDLKRELHPSSAKQNSGENCAGATMSVMIISPASLNNRMGMS